MPKWRQKALDYSSKTTTTPTKFSQVYVTSAKNENFVLGLFSILGTFFVTALVAFFPP